MKLKWIALIGGIFFILIALALIVITNNGFHKNINNSSSIYLNTTTSIVTVEPNNSLSYPSNDFTINHINWSSYPNLATGYVYTIYIAGPNDVISHKFIEVQICTEVKDIENRSFIEEQLGGVAREAKKIYGPNSGIDIIGTKGGIARWFVSILPYEETVR